MFTRGVTLVGATILSFAGAIALASPASAAYSSEPIPVAWTADGPVHSSLAVGSTVYLGGMFSGGGGIVALDSSTGAPRWSLPANGDVRAIAMSGDGATLFVGGAFTLVNGVTRRHLAAINVADGSLLPTWKATASGLVRDLVVVGDTLFVGGQFAKMNGLEQRGLGAVIASTGKPFTGFTTFVDRQVYGLALSGTSLVFSGNFTLVNGSQARSSLASVNLTTFQLTPWAPRRLCSGCSKYWDVVVDGTKAYVATSGLGGYIGAYSLSTASTVWRVFADGDVQTLLLPGDGLLYIGGHFGEFVGSSANDRELMAALSPVNGAVDPNFHPHFTTHYPGVWTIAATPGVLWAGGDFTGVDVGGTNNRVPYLAAFGS